MPLETKEELDAELKKYEKKMPPAQMKALRTSFEKLMEGSDMKEAMGISKESEEALYSLAYQLFNTGQYRKAWGCFCFLRDLEPFSYRYNFAIAACFQYMGKYADASATYLIASLIDNENPVPCFHMYECLLKQDKPEEAASSLKNAIFRAENKPDYEPLLARAQLEYKQLRKESVIEEK